MCSSPIILKVKIPKSVENLYTQPVPCGKCAKCIKARLSAWLFRFEQEMKISYNPLFITLTYNDDNLLYTDTGKTTLYKRDVQLFVKRLRKTWDKTSPLKLKYFAVGEYGTKRNRPHYHMILFNLDTNNAYEIINQSWNKGFVDVSKITDLKAVAYTLKYITTKPMQQKDNSREKEFSLCSQGIGKNYLTPQIIKYHQQSINKCFVQLQSGSKISIPKYFKEKIYDETTRKKVTTYNQERAKSALSLKISKYNEIYPQFSREQCEDRLTLNQQSVKITRKNEVL